MDDPIKVMLREYSSRFEVYEAFGTMMENLLGALIGAQGIRVHSITHRTKDPAHLEEKLTRPGKNYSGLDDVTDLVGLRIITYFADDVDTVVKMINDQFDVDESKSVDKRISMEPDRFGYVSVHQVCRLSHDRLQLVEYSSYGNTVAEIQTRSILQHAWAEIEHDLGYKNANGIPLLLRRRFSILASLLELADDEFIRLRNELDQYARQIETEVTESPSSVLLDNVSLRLFIETDEVARGLDTAIASVASLPLTPEVKVDYLENRFEELKALGFSSIADLRSELEDNKRNVIALMHRIYHPKRPQPKAIPRGVALFFLTQVLIAARSSTVEETCQKLEELRIFPPSRRRDRAALLFELMHHAGAGTTPADGQ